MRQNPERRAALVDAAIDVLAGEGGRGLTFRAVDKQAGVPLGTASNYFANRQDLLTQAGRRIHVRLALPPEELDALRATEPGRGLLLEMMRGLVRRTLDDRTGYLALLELRLEATRRPEVRAALAETLSANLRGNIEGAETFDIPADEATVLTLYFSIGYLLVEQLTVPDVLADRDLDELIATLVDRAMPPPA
jgi:AcrR family transcriptional regulator